MNDRPGKATARQATRRKSAYHHNDLRNAVLAEALDHVVARNGPHFSLREIASALGVSHSSVYRHFADKGALLDALTAEGFATLRRYQQDVLAGVSDDGLSQLRALCIAYVRFAREKLGFFRLLFDDRPETEASGRGAFDVGAYEFLISLIRRCQDEGHVIAGDPGRISGYLVLAPHGLAHYLSQPRAPGVAPKGPLPLMSAEDLSELALIPLLCHPPPPDSIAKRFFGPARPVAET